MGQFKSNMTNSYVIQIDVILYNVIDLYKLHWQLTFFPSYTAEAQHYGETNPPVIWTGWNMGGWVKI